MTTEKLDIGKARGRPTWDVTLKGRQSIRFVDDEGYIHAEMEVRDGRLYLIKHRSLRGHTPGGESFGVVTGAKNELMEQQLDDQEEGEAQDGGRK